MSKDFRGANAVMSYRVEVCMVLQCGRVGHRQKRSGLRVAGTGSELRLDTCRRLLQHQRWRLHNWRKVGNTIIFLCFLTELGSFWTDVTPAILSRDFVAQLYRATKLQVCHGVSRKFSTATQLFFRIQQRSILCNFVAKMLWTLIGQFSFMRQSCIGDTACHTCNFVAR